MATGGPMFYADAVGLKHIADRLRHHADTTGDETLRPAALLERLAAEGKGFAGLLQGAAAPSGPGRAHA